MPSLIRPTRSDNKAVVLYAGAYTPPNEVQLPFQDNVVNDDLPVDGACGLSSSNIYAYVDRDGNEGKRPLSGAMPSASR